MVDGEKFHDGIDLATFCGDTIVAAHDGVVLAAGRHYDDQMGWIGDLSTYYARLDAKKLWIDAPDRRRHRRRQRLSQRLRALRQDRRQEGPDGHGRRAPRLRGPDGPGDRLSPPLRPVQPIGDRPVRDRSGGGQAHEAAGRRDRPDRPTARPAARTKPKPKPSASPAPARNRDSRSRALSKPQGQRSRPRRDEVRPVEGSSVPVGADALPGGWQTTCGRESGACQPGVSASGSAGR